MSETDSGKLLNNTGGPPGCSVTAKMAGTGGGGREAPEGGSIYTHTHTHTLEAD